MRASLKTTKWIRSEFSHTRVEISTRGSGSTGEKTEKELSITYLEPNSLDSSKMTLPTGRAPCGTRIRVNTKAIGRMGLGRGMESTILVMGASMTANGATMKNTEMDN